jgi:hypothetical protein
VGQAHIGLKVICFGVPSVVVNRDHGLDRGVVGSGKIGFAGVLMVCDCERISRLIVVWGIVAGDDAMSYRLIGGDAS